MIVVTQFILLPTVQTSSIGTLYTLGRCLRLGMYDQWSGLTITVRKITPSLSGDQHSASCLDASSYAEALPTLSLSPYQGWQDSLCQTPSPLAFSCLHFDLGLSPLTIWTSDMLSCTFIITGHRRPHHNYLKSFCLRPVACWSPFTWGLE